MYKYDQYGRLWKDNIIVEPDEDYLAWNATNDTPSFVATYPLVPSSVTSKQIRRALSTVGLRANVETYATTLSQDLQDEYNHSLVFHRNNVALLEAASMLGLTSKQIDDIFILAATYQ